PHLSPCPSLSPYTTLFRSILDVLPTLDTWDVLHGVDAAVAWHLYLMAQPPGLPERMIAATADEFFGSFLDAWGGDDRTIPAEVRDHYLAASRPAAPRSDEHTSGLQSRVD